MGTGVRTCLTESCSQYSHSTSNKISAESPSNSHIFIYSLITKTFLKNILEFFHIPKVVPL